jgi:hypothetical protein
MKLRDMRACGVQDTANDHPSKSHSPSRRQSHLGYQLLGYEACDAPFVRA